MLRHQGHRPAQLTGPQISQIHAIKQQLPLLRFVEAQQKREQCGFARPRGTHQSHHLTGLHLKAQVMEHRLIGLIPKAHLLQLQAAAQGRQGLGISPIRALHRFTLNFTQTAQGGLPLLKLVEVGDQAGDRINQDQQRRNETAEAGATEPTCTDAQGTDQQHRQDAGGLNETHHRVLQGQQPHRAVAGAAMQLNLLLKTLLQPGFSCKSTHQGQSGNGFPQQPRQLAHLLLAAFSRTQNPGGKTADQHGHHRCQQDGGDRELPIQQHHVAEHHHQLQDAGDRFLDVLVDHLTDAIGVFREAVGEITGGELLQRSKFQPLQPSEDLPPQRLGHMQCRRSQQGVLAELSQLLHKEDRERQHDHPQHPREITITDGGDQLAGLHGQQRPGAHKQEHAHAACKKAGAVGAQQRQQPAKTGR